jgi:hypothetical protein
LPKGPGPAPGAFFTDVVDDSVAAMTSLACFDPPRVEPLRKLLVMAESKPNSFFAASTCRKFDGDEIYSDCRHSL